MSFTDTLYVYSILQVKHCTHTKYLLRRGAVIDEIVKDNGPEITIVTNNPD